MPFTRGSAQQSGLEIVLSNFEAFENKFYDVKYPEIFWQKVIPAGAVETDIPGGATSTSYGVRDWSGAGGFDVSLSGQGNTVGMSYSKPVNIPIFAASVDSEISREDIRVFNFAHGGKMDTENAAIMKKACERHVEGVVFYGDADIGFTGWLNIPGVANVQAFLNAGATSRKFADKTPDEILKDINTNMAAVFKDSLQIHMVNALYLPTEQYADLATRRMGILESSKTVLQYIKEMNLYTVSTGQELTIESIPHLAGSGPGGSDKMALVQNDPDYFKMPFPIPYTFLPPAAIGRIVKLYSEYKFGGVHNRWPASMVFVYDI